jgi:peptidyl-dipeptidase Dcp
MNIICPRISRRMCILTAASVMVLSSVAGPAFAAGTEFGPSNPFYTQSKLPFQAPPFDRIKDSDYQPAIEAGMAQQLVEMKAIADNSAPPTFENTLVAMEKTGQLFSRVMMVFSGVTGANINPVLQKVQDIEAPRLAAHDDAIYLDSKLFRRVETIYKERDSLKLDPESLKLVDFYYKKFVD